MTTTLDQSAFTRTLDFFIGLKLLTDAEATEVMAMFKPDFPYAAAMAAAESVHLHAKVQDVDALPHDEIRAQGVEATSCKKGYIKYPFPGGINMIISDASLPITEDETLRDLELPPYPYLDHKGIDLRKATKKVRAIFDKVPAVAAKVGWRHTPQGGPEMPVYCCHIEVEAKHWVYPNLDAAGQSLPIEFAFGPLTLHDEAMGCDLRPIDPGHPRAEAARAALAACSAGKKGAAANGAAAGKGAGNGTVTNSYYERGDLGHFTDMGKYAKGMMDKFWAYYNAAIGTDGALTKREKALIALAVAHSKQCPYCIDAYTNTLAEMNVGPDEMHEAVHVAAALGAGIDLVHGVQMQNALKLRGVIN